MKTLSRRDFAKNITLVFFSGAGLASVTTVSCSNDDPSSPNDPGSNNGFVINLADFPALADAGGVQGFDYKGTPIYVFRTGDSSFRALSRVCTHRGCTVDWHDSSKKLACPCHGSEFSDQGSVLKGPASSPLQEFPISYNAANGSLTVGS